MRAGAMQRNANRDRPEADFTIGASLFSRAQLSGIKLRLEWTLGHSAPLQLTAGPRSPEEFKMSGRQPNANANKQGAGFGRDAGRFGRANQAAARL